MCYNIYVKILVEVYIFLEKEFFMNTIDMTKICEPCRCAMDKMKSTMCTLKGMTIKNKACFDFQIKSKDKTKPVFCFSKNFDKEVKVLPIIAALLGVLLIITIMSGDKKDN